MSKAAPPKQAWTTLSQSVLLERAPYFRVVQERVRTNSGKEIDDYYRVYLPSFAVCVPVTADGRVVTLWQYKHGPRAYSLTFPGGFIDPGEEPATTTRRELLEETGYKAENIIKHGSFVDGGNQSGSQGHYFTATGCNLFQEPQYLDLETIDIRLMTTNEVNAALNNGQFAIGHHVLAWLLSHHTIQN